MGGGQGQYIQYIEVRVGDTDAAATVKAGQRFGGDEFIIFTCEPLRPYLYIRTSRICANTLCKTTVGEYAIRVEKSDCAGGVPIRGRYITIQRFKAPLADKELLILAEVDVEFYI